MSSSNVTPIKQPIEDDAAREALEDILRSRKKFADLMRTGEFQQLSLTNQVRIEHAADLFEHALEGLVRDHRKAVEIMRQAGENAWAELSGVFRRTRDACLEHENAKAELKSLMPEDAKEAIGHGIRAKRSKSGAVSFDLLTMEGASHASLQ
jgi:hypothetical protein